MIPNSVKKKQGQYKNTWPITKEDFNKFIIDNGLSVSEDILAQIFDYYFDTGAAENINSIAGAVSMGYNLNEFATKVFKNKEALAKGIADMADRQ